MKFIFNINCHDFACAYRGYNLDELGDFNIRNISSRGYSFFMEVVYHLHNMGIFIKEIPFYAKQRSSGKSKIPNIEIIRTLFNIFRLKFKKILKYFTVHILKNHLGMLYLMQLIMVNFLYWIRIG